MIKRINRISLMLIILLLILCPIVLSGCSQSLNELETDTVGKWQFSDFFVGDNETANSIHYKNLGANSTYGINLIVKNIGDYYKDSILDLSNNKQNNKLEGTFSQDNKTIKIKWWCPEGQLKIGFDNLIIYSVQGTKTNPIMQEVDLGICWGGIRNELIIAYRTHEFSSYIKFTKI